MLDGPCGGIIIKICKIIYKIRRTREKPYRSGSYTRNDAELIDIFMTFTIPTHSKQSTSTDEPFENISRQIVIYPVWSDEKTNSPFTHTVKHERNLKFVTKTKK